MTNGIDKPAPLSRNKQARRRLLGILASGGGAAAGIKTLPAHWTQPVMDNVLLPAHAQTTGAVSLEDPCDITIEVVQDDIIGTVSGMVTGGGNLGGIQINLFFVPTDGGDVVEIGSDETTTTSPDGTYGPIQVLFIPNTCPQFIDGIQVTVTSPDPRLAGQVAICTAGFQKDCDG